jgi:hypothetical protein
MGEQREDRESGRRGDALQYGHVYLCFNPAYSTLIPV